MCSFNIVELCSHLGGKLLRNPLSFSRPDLTFVSHPDCRGVTRVRAARCDAPCVTRFLLSLRGLCARGAVPLLLLGTGLRVLCSLTRARQLTTQGTLGGLQLSLWGALLSAVLSFLLLPEFFTQCPQRRGTRASVWDPRTCTVAGHCVGCGQ